MTSILRYNIDSLHLGWYLDWGTAIAPPQPNDVAYAQMIWGTPGALRPAAETIAAIARANPGALWLVGNEPDVRWQGNMTPEAYARFYNEAHTAITSADPTAQVAIGGVSQPTPLRLRYLDQVLAAYRQAFDVEMPVNVWNVHNFILREERDGWGVDIPPGLPDDQGLLIDVDDVDDVARFRQQLVDFRRWMAERGYRDAPLVVSEYGIPMPEEYGFPPQRVAAFLAATFNVMLTATDPDIGYPADGNRLVQQWCWYSLADTVYPTGNLFDPQTGALTPLGATWAEYVGEW
ncbi:MAG: hypothetical protein JXD18_10705 [Anaerolineae bacterium]|nr:hypothetical protein [Anaerolineae bacterium]